MNTIFKIHRYVLDYAGFVDNERTQGNPIEIKLAKGYTNNEMADTLTGIHIIRLAAALNDGLPR
jgi:hypothetical protein